MARVSTRRAAARTPPPQPGTFEDAILAGMREHAAELRQRLANPRVAVFRSRTATLGYEDHVEAFAIEDGGWRAD